ncbi:MAG: beta-N-acetylhexosaminidase [Vicinamibacterales bacterium]
MSKEIRRHIGQLIIAGFSGCTIPEELRALARELDLGGIILFGRNVEAPEQVAELAHAAQGLARDLPLWVSVDQEGGRVARLRSPFTLWPPMQTLGRSGDDKLAGAFAQALARELRAVGVTLDYAPVLDVQTNARNPVIGDRALSGRADVVARLGATIIDALQGEGVAACGKHFPGHGDTDRDSHHELPVVGHSPERLREIELEPFRAAIAREVAAIMTAHVLYPAIDDEQPATLSRQIITGLLREDLGFDGLIATDDMEMAAVSERHSVEDGTVRAVAAGCDMVLLCGTDVGRQVAALEALIRAVEEERLPAKRVEDALARQAKTKARFLGHVREWRPPTSKALQEVLGCDRHVSIAEEMERYVS